MAAGHLSTPYGVGAIAPEHLKTALQNGTVFGGGLNELQQELVQDFFSETALHALIECINQANAPWDKVYSLYQESLKNLGYPNKGFEEILEKQV